MKADEFVREIFSLKKSLNGLAEFNYSENLKSIFLKSYDISINEGFKEFYFRNEIELLLNKYKIHDFVVGAITLGFEKGGALNSVIGNFEADYLILDDTDGKVKLADYEDVTFVMQECAKDSESFLSALCKLKEYEAEDLVNPDVELDDESLKKRALNCSILAGGELYLDFYSFFYGV